MQEVGAKKRYLADKHMILEAILYDWMPMFDRIEVSDARNLRASDEEMACLSCG